MKLSSVFLAISGAAIAIVAHSPITRAQTLVPLSLYWNSDRPDAASVATRESRNAQLESGYQEINVQGCLLANPQPETAPLYLYWNSQRQDNASVASTALRSAQIDEGYSEVRIEGYVFLRPVPGTIPLEVWWQANRQDNATVTTLPRQLTNEGYGKSNIEGYIYPADRCS